MGNLPLVPMTYSWPQGEISENRAKPKGLVMSLIEYGYKIANLLELLILSPNYSNYSKVWNNLTVGGSVGRAALVETLR